MDSPGLSRAKRYAQYARRFWKRSHPGIISARIVSGTNTFGMLPSVVPSKPLGATPMMVIVCPFTMIRSLTTFGFAPSRLSQ